MRERTMRDLIEARVLALGGEYRALRYLSRKDCPDLFVLLPDRHIFIEAKRPGKLPTPAQAREMEKMRKSNCEVYTITCVAELDKYLPLKGVV